MALPDNEYVFDFDEVGETTGTEYKGQFTSVCVLDMLQKQLLGIEKTKLQADFVNPDPELKGVAVILSNLRVRIQDAPEWWQQSQGGYNLKDENVVVALFDKVMEGEDQWRDKVKKTNQAKSDKATTQSETSETPKNTTTSTQTTK